MNLLSFVDELIKVGAMGISTQKEASADSDITPESIEVRPDEAATRLPLTTGVKPAVLAGTLGTVGESRNPIDQPTLGPG